MLQSATVHPATLAILKKIMLMPVFKPFNLVGGKVNWQTVKKTIEKKVEAYLKQSHF